MDFPIKNGGSFHSYVKLPEGIHHESIINPWLIPIDSWFIHHQPGYVTLPEGTKKTSIRQRVIHRLCPGFSPDLLDHLQEAFEAFLTSRQP